MQKIYHMLTKYLSTDNQQNRGLPVDLYMYNVLLLNSIKDLFHQMLVCAWPNYKCITPYLYQTNKLTPEI